MATQKKKKKKKKKKKEKSGGGGGKSKWRMNETKRNEPLLFRNGVP